MYVQLQFEIVEDHELPAGIDRVLVERTCGEPLLLIARRASLTLAFLAKRESRLRAVS